MKASPAHQKELLRLQEQDNRLARIAHSLKNLPQDKQLDELKPQAEQLRARLVEVTGRLEDAKAEQQRLESDVAVVEQRLARDAERLQVSVSPKDIEGLEAEIASLNRRRSTLEDAELEVMERAETAEQELAAVKAEQEQLAASVDSLTTARDAEIARFQRERDDAAADRMVVAQGIPQELLDLYERQRSRYGVGAAAVRGGVNLGTNLTISPSDLNAVRAAAPDEVIIDSDSGAILVRDENS
ncbi:zinc ribbon domain-containing protein [Gryllotalpicola koreensis]|uniref:CT398-like coiled coil hairpin domain-containing protein n=1 Tax=Gryllotalpicola koreensis TaxID=993086 RepID=A0ABP7ZWC4_9MICO